jgi:hypothetical protein
MITQVEFYGVRILDPIFWKIVKIKNSSLPLRLLIFGPQTQLDIWRTPDYASKILFIGRSTSKSWCCNLGNTVISATYMINKKHQSLLNHLSSHVIGSYVYRFCASVGRPSTWYKCVLAYVWKSPQGRACACMRMGGPLSKQIDNLPHCPLWSYFLYLLADCLVSIVAGTCWGVHKCTRHPISRSKSIYAHW